MRANPYLPSSSDRFPNQLISGLNWFVFLK
jgi:hypothetical protein